MKKPDMKAYISKWEQDAILIIRQLADKWNCPSPKYAEYPTCKLILNFKSIGLNISPAIIHLKINAVRFVTFSSAPEKDVRETKLLEAVVQEWKKPQQFKKLFVKFCSKRNFDIILKGFRTTLEYMCGTKSLMTLWDVVTFALWLIIP